MGDTTKVAHLSVDRLHWQPKYILFPNCSALSVYNLMCSSELKAALLFSEQVIHIINQSNVIIHNC
jgi:hypothetical protein